MRARKIRRKAKGDLVALRLPRPRENGDPREIADAVREALPGFDIKTNGLGTVWFVYFPHGELRAIPGDWIVYDRTNVEAWTVAAPRFDELYEIDEEDE